MNASGASRTAPAATSAAEIERLARRVRWRIGGGALLPGRARGGALGASGEFEGYRRYEPADDLRRIDMKVYARLRRPMVRLLRADSMVPLTVLIDRSASMASPVQDRAASELGAFFFALARRNGDALRGFLFRDGELRPIAAPRANLAGLAALFLDEPARGESDYARSFRRVPPHAA
ncbi:MAG: DUF58 domain-containing protein, partial [Planctomycetes bacterium]|nr:DUF58 domain-containing protein [Planctomycetota bacterium]